MKMESWYDEQEDILNIELEDGKDYWKSIELADGVVLDISREGRVVAVEILGASRIFSGEVRRVLEVAKQIGNETGSDS